MEETLEQPPQKARRISGAITWLMRTGMWLLLGGWLLSYFGQHFYIAELLSNFRLQFLILFGVALLLTYFARAKRLLLICLLVAFGFSAQETLRIYLPADQPVPGKTKVRLMSFNVWAVNWGFEEVIDEIRLHDPDVLVVLEYAGMWHEALNALNKSYPFQHRDPRWHGYGIAVFSKLPLENAKSIPLTKTEIDNPAIEVSLRIDGQLLNLTAGHVMSPVSRYRLKLRNQQFEELAESVNAKSSPKILVGDMNCTTASGYLANLISSTQLRDSRQGFGIHTSWVKFAPLITVPIDHVLVSEEIHIHDRFTGSPADSDHRPVIVDFSISE